MQALVDNDIVPLLSIAFILFIISLFVTILIQTVLRGCDPAVSPDPVTHIFV